MKYKKLTFAFALLSLFGFGVMFFAKMTSSHMDIDDMLFGVLIFSIPLIILLIYQTIFKADLDKVDLDTTNNKAAKSIKMMSFWQAIKTCFLKYGIFNGRATRAEFWWFMLLFIPLANVGRGTLEVCYESGLLCKVWPFAMALWFGTALPALAVTARRLHDIGISGWWQLLLNPLLVPIIIAACFPSKKKANQYGDPPNPHFPPSNPNQNTVELPKTESFPTTAKQ